MYIGGFRLLGFGGNDRCFTVWVDALFLARVSVSSCLSLCVYVWEVAVARSTVCVLDCLQI